MTEERTPTDGKPVHREIRSFVLRQGRTTEAQREALERDWPRFGLDWSRPMAHPASWFSSEQPVVVEIGFGNGEALGAAAAADPGRNYLGIEVHRPGVGRLLRQLAAENLDNVRVISADAVEVLREGIAPGSLDEVRLYFPDPWHKKRHHKRRILAPGFVTDLARIVKPGGFFHAATDWQDYAEHMLAVLSASPAFTNRAGEGRFAPRPDTRPMTKFERRGQRLGHGVWDLIFNRRG